MQQTHQVYHWEPQSPPSSNYPRAPRRAFPALRLWRLMLAAALDLQRGVLSGRDSPNPCSGPGSATSTCPGTDPIFTVVVRYVSEPDLAVAEEDLDAILISASWDSSSFPQDEEEGDIQELTFETGPSSETTSDTGLSPLPSSMRGAQGVSLQVPLVPWTAAPKLRQSVFRTWDPLPHLQPFPAFPDFLEEIASMLTSRAPVRESKMLVSTRDKHGDSDGPDLNCPAWRPEALSSGFRGS
ncbi:UNVERIFIED_CONTAM: hypothetical protein FKN15_032227 [Acipenser sinensis]